MRNPVQPAALAVLVLALGAAPALAFTTVVPQTTDRDAEARAADPDNVTNNLARQNQDSGNGGSEWHIGSTTLRLFGTSSSSDENKFNWNQRFLQNPNVPLTPPSH